MTGDEWLADYQRRIAEIGATAQRARDALDGLTATASSANGDVTVTVNSAGALQDVIFRERAEDMSLPRLAQAVLDAARDAHATAARKSAEALEPLIGGTAASRYLASQQAAGGQQ
jgi:DNA-binding protein YbaB